MPSHDLVIDNQSGANFRADVNEALEAIATQQADTADPPDTYPYQRQARTDLGVVRRRNAANTVWHLDGTLAETLIIPRSSNTILGLANHQCTIVATGTFTQTITAAATLTGAWYCYYRNAGTGVITLDANGSETIDGSLTKVLGPDQSCILFSDGSNLHTVGSGSSGWNLIASQTAAASATVDFVSGLSDSYDDYMVHISACRPATDDVYFAIRVGTGIGPTWQDGISAYGWGANGTLINGSFDDGSGISPNVSTLIPLSRTTGSGHGVGNASGEHIDTIVEFSNPDATLFPVFQYRSAYIKSDGVIAGMRGVGNYGASGAIAGIRFLFSSGNIAAGTFRLYGLRK